MVEREARASLQNIENNLNIMHGQSLLLLVISIIVSYTRIYLGRHTYKQVVKGYIASTLFTLVAYGVLNAIYRL